MNNILLVGNGFDLAHQLCTSYNDFLCIMKNWNLFLAHMKNGKYYIWAALNTNNIKKI